ncbi:MAG: hypothetical protein V2I33_23000 [Kangiellaceae bacterium]|jgi:hypothetical protein|nr:hypothetical protein [Kangiellaceae bacterium]
MRLLSNEERLTKLREKASERDTLVGALNALPIGKESVSLTLRRKEYERQITAVEKEMRKYDQKYVYVPI